MFERGARFSDKLAIGATELAAAIYASHLVAGLGGIGAEGWGVRQVVAAVVVWRVLAFGLGRLGRLAARSAAPDWMERLRILLIFGLTSATLWRYATPDLAGPKDSRWYGNLVIDFLTRLRSGEFPVFSGESTYAFNGNILTIRTAPAHLFLSAVIDALTFHSLTPLAVQHAALLVCYVGGSLAVYVLLARLRPGARWVACLMAAIYATSPSILTPLILHDMYMTVTAMPLIAVACYAACRAIEAGERHHFFLLGVACAAAWYAHPPLAFLLSVATGVLLASKIIGEGLSGRFLSGCILTGIVAGVLMAPLLYATSEIAPTHYFYPVTNLVMPIAGMTVLIWAVARSVTRREPYLLVLLPVAVLALWMFKPSALPFVSVMMGLFLLAALADHFQPWLGLRNRTEPWLMACAIAGAGAAALWFPGSSLPANDQVAHIVARTRLMSVTEFLRLIAQGSDSQPHLIWWVLLAGSLLLVWRSESRFGRVALAVAVASVLAILPVPYVKNFIWSNGTVEFFDLFEDGDWLRFWPFAVPVLLFAVHVMLADLPPGSLWRRIVLGVTIAAVPWAAVDHWKSVRAIFVRTSEETARYFRPENVVLYSYSWDLLHKPEYYLSGVIDPRLEFRLWKQGPGRELLVDPDVIARELEKRGGELVNLVATRDVTYPQWVYFAPRIRLEPGDHKLVRFDFKGREPVGTLIIRGKDIYREYSLPSSGLGRSFGAGKLNTRTISLWNSGSQPEELELVVKRDGPASTEPVDPTGVPSVTISRFDPKLSPVEVFSLSPLHFRIQSPEKAMLETFRSAYPGYRVSVNGQPVPYIYSRDGLVAFEVPAGASDVSVRFRGTWQLRDLFWFGVVTWTLALGRIIALTRRAMPQITSAKAG